MKMRARTLAMVMAAALIGAACSSLNPFARATAPMAPLPATQSKVSLEPLWSAKVGEAGAYRFQPAVVNRTVYAAGGSGVVTRIDNGSVTWRVDLRKDLSAGVGSDGKVVVVAARSGEVIGLDADDGSELWRTPLAAEFLAQPAVSGSMAVLRTSDHQLIALESRTGKKRWEYQRSTPPLSLRNFSGVRIEGNMVVAGFPGGKIAAVNLANGAAMWELAVALPRGATELERVADVAGTPVLMSRQLCAVSYQGRAACFDGSTGNALWSREMSSTRGMESGGDALFVTDDRDNVIALDSTNGASLWQHGELNRRVLTRPLLSGKRLLVGDVEGYLHVLSRDDGAYLGRVRADSSAIAADPQTYGDGVVVQTRDGGVYAYALR